jgi:hypothetical protein
VIEAISESPDLEASLFRASGSPEGRAGIGARRRRRPARLLDAACFGPRPRRSQPSRCPPPQTPTSPRPFASIKPGSGEGVAARKATHVCTRSRENARKTEVHCEISKSLLSIGCAARRKPENLRPIGRIASVHPANPAIT